MSLYSLNVVARPRALSSAFRPAAIIIFCNLNRLPKRRLAVTNHGRAIAKHPAVYSPIRGNLGYFLASGGYFAEFGRKRRRKRQSHAAAFGSFAPLSQRRH